MTLVRFLKIEFVDTATERYSALVMLQATWREPKLDNTVSIEMPSILTEVIHK